VSVIGLLAVDAAHKNKELNYYYYHHHHHHHHWIMDIFMTKLWIVIMNVKACMTPSIRHNLALAGTQGFVSNIE
jgi:hypothetical protein